VCLLIPSFQEEGWLGVAVFPFLAAHGADKKENVLLHLKV
jgi:hypothetical protein